MAEGLAGRFGISNEAARVAQVYAGHGTAAKVTERTGVPQKRVRSHLTDSRVQAAIEAELKRNLNQGAALALNTIKELTHSARDERVRLQAAKDWLDRAGYKPEHMHTSADARQEHDAQELQQQVVQMLKDLGFSPEALGFNMKVIDQTPSGEKEPDNVQPTGGQENSNG